MKFNKQLVFRYIIFLVIIILLFALISILAKREKPGYQTPPPAIEIIKPTKGNLNQSISITGYVEALDMIPVVPFVSGTILEYPIKAGMQIKKGDLLAKIDDAPYRQQMLQAKAAYFGYQSTFERIENLYKANAATQQNYDSTKAQRDASRAQYDLAELQLSYTKVISPSSGTILMAPLAKGSIGSTQQPIAIIADLSKQVIRLNVNEKYFDLFTNNKNNISAIIKRPKNNSNSEQIECVGILDNISPYIQSESKTFQVVINLQGNSEQFRPGMYVDVEVIYAKYNDVFLLPLSVLKVDSSCYLYNTETNKVQYVLFDSSIHDKNNFIVPNEYSNSVFVLNGQNTVFDNQTVTVVNQLENTL